MADLKEIKDVEIFAVGTFNGETYTLDHLHEMVRAFDANKDTLRPFLKLGHNDEQKILASDGLPAAGWVAALRVIGTKLVADFTDIPSKIFELIENKAFRNVSSEIFHNITVGDKPFSRMLSAVALLGADMPAVGTLNDILANFKLTGFKPVKTYATETEVDIHSHSYPEHMEGEMPKSENEVNLERDLQDSKKSYAKVLKEKDAADKLAAEQKKDIEKRDTEVADLKKFKVEQEKVNARLALEAKVAKDEKFITELESANLSTPAMKPYVMQWLDEGKKEYSVEEKKFSRGELLKEILKLHAAADVNFDESSSAGEKGSKTQVSEAAIEKYEKENKCSYSDAYKAVMRGK